MKAAKKAVKKKLSRKEQAEAGLIPPKKKRASDKKKAAAKKKAAKPKKPTKPERDRSKAMSRISQYREALWKALTVTDLEKIMKVVVKGALRGDLDCIKICLERAVGKPLQPTAAVQHNARELATEARDYLKEFFG